MWRGPSQNGIYWESNDMTKRALKYVYSMVRSWIVFLIETAFRILEICVQVFPPSSWGCLIRGWIYRPFLRKCGRNFQVGIGAKLEHINNIQIGDNVYIGHGSWISGIRGGIILEDDVMLGPAVNMVSSNHTLVDGSYRFGPGIGAEIRIGKGTWIAANSVVTAGVRIGESSLVAAGAVVTKDFEPGSIIGGIPAKKIGKSREQSATKVVQ